MTPDEAAVATFMWQVWRRDNIQRMCRKPTTCQKFGEGGYRAAWQAMLEVITESAARHHCAGPVLDDLIEVARGVLETTWTEDYAERWASLI